MITRQRVLEVLKALEADERVWVAGSAAILPEKADDIDLWVMKKSTLKASEFEPSIWAELQGANQAHYETIPEIVKRLECVVPGVEGFSEPLKIQLMFTQFKSPMDLLEHFDVSCHAWARNKDGFLVASPKATVPGSPIVRLKSKGSYDWANACDCDDCKQYQKKITEPDLTDKRIEEFTLRYAETTRDMCWLPA